MMFQALVCFCFISVSLCEEKRANGDNSEIAFSAGLTKMLTLQHTERVVYDRIFTNMGSAYSSSTGTFSCPQAGIYVFTFHSVSHNNKAAWLQMYHNYEYVASSYGHTASDYASSGNTVILRLASGDEVYVQAVDPAYGYDTNMYGDPNEVYCTFSGYLVSPIYEEVPVIGGR